MTQQIIRSLWKDITWVSILKITLLIILWKVSFSHPIKTHLTVDHMRQQLIG